MGLMHHFARLLYPTGSTRRVRRGALAGLRFRVSPGMGATFAWGYDSMHWRFLAERVCPGMTIYDVGGNRGQMAMFFSIQTGPTGKVVSFEPVPANFDVLQEHVSENQLTNVTVMNVALDETIGERAFVFDQHDHTMGSFDGLAVKLPGRSPSLNVKCETIDHLVATSLPPPDLIKIDVEGAGARVIAGAVQTLDRFRPRLYIELHATDEEAPELRLLGELRSRWGYSITDIDAKLQLPKDQHWGAAVWCEPPGKA